MKLGLEGLLTDERYDSITIEGVVKKSDVCDICECNYQETMFSTICNDSGGIGITSCKNCSYILLNYYRQSGQTCCIHFIDNKKEALDWCNYNSENTPSFLINKFKDKLFFNSIGLTLNGLELLRTYQTLPTQSGVYFFYDSVEDNYLYIGSSNNIKERILTHLGFSKKYSNGNKQLYFKFYEYPKRIRIGWIILNNKEYWEYTFIDKFNPILNKLGKKSKERNYVS